MGLDDAFGDIQPQAAALAVLAAPGLVLPPKPFKQAGQSLLRYPVTIVSEADAFHVALPPYGQGED